MDAVLANAASRLGRVDAGTLVEGALTGGALADGRMRCDVLCLVGGDYLRPRPLIIFNFGLHIFHVLYPRLNAGIVVPRFCKPLRFL